MADQADADDTGPVATEGSLRMADDEVSVPDIPPWWIKGAKTVSDTLAAVIPDLAG